MASRIALLCLLGLLLAAASPAIAANNYTDIYYQLGLVWPGAYCEQTSAGCCKPTDVSPARDFYITGLTVFNATTDAALTKCSNQVPYDPNLIYWGLEGLNQYWSNIRCPSNDGQSSWRSIWNKYGACSGLSVKAYFEKALSFRSRINPLVRLKANGIQDDFDLYGLKAIKKVFKKKSGGISATPVIQCSKGPFDKYMLYQLYFCANWNGTFIDCPAPRQYTCTKTILFHPFKKWMLQQKQKQQEEELNDEDDAFEQPGLLAMDS